MQLSKSKFGISISFCDHSFEMGSSCEGLQIAGVLRKGQEMQMVLELKPNSGVPWENCGFCNTKWDSNTNELHSGEIQHSHEIKGVFSFIPSENQWTLTFSDCENEEQRQEIIKKPPLCSENVKSNVSQQKKISSPLQYEVDGKVYELRSSLQPKKARNVDSPNINKSFDTPSQPVLQTKAIEFVIENKKYSTSSVNAKPYEDTQETVVNDRSTSSSLELLQVCKILSCFNHIFLYFQQHRSNPRFTKLSAGENDRQLHHSRSNHLWARYFNLSAKHERIGQTCNSFWPKYF